MISIVVPVYNSEKILPTLCNEIKKEMCKHDYTYEIILVNDASKDNSERIIRDLSLNDKNIKGILLAQNAGQQNSTLAGIRHSKFRLILTMDDDLQNNPRDIHTLLNSLDNQTDIVYGVPSRSNSKVYRLLGTLFKEFCFYLFLKKPKDVRLTSFRLMRGDIIDWIKSDPLPKVYISARALQLKPIIKNVEVSHNQRFHGSSNYTPISLIKKLLCVILNYRIVHLFLKNTSYSNQYSIKEILK